MRHGVLSYSGDCIFRLVLCSLVNRNRSLVFVIYVAKCYFH